MPDQYTIHRLVCSTPPGLEEERDLFLAALASFAERVSMPEWVLLAPATFVDAFDANLQQAAVKNNIKNGVFFLGIFGQDPADPVYKRFVEYAIECAADPGLPMKRVTVFFKESADTAEEMRALRARFAEQCEVRAYRNLKDLEPQLEDILAGWFAAVKP